MISKALFLTGARALVCWKPWGPKTMLWCWEIMAWSLLVQIVRGLLFGTWRSFVTLKSNYVRCWRENYKEFLLPSWPGPESNLREVLRRPVQKTTIRNGMPSFVWLIKKIQLGNFEFRKSITFIILNQLEKQMQQPPFCADHVWSFLRPEFLLDAREQFWNQDISSEQLREVEKRAIRDIVKFQENLGLEGITDGEYRRTYLHKDFLTQLRVVGTEGGINVSFKTADGWINFAPPVMKVEGKVSHLLSI